MRISLKYYKHINKGEGGKTNGKHVEKWNATERKNAFYADEFIV